MRHQLLDETRISAQFRSGAQRTREARAGQLDHAHYELLVLPAWREKALLEQLIDLFDGTKLLVEGEIAGELVAPVHYLEDRPRLGLELLGVNLDHPDLVRSLVCQFPDRGVLREQAVPVVPPVAGPYRAEERRDGRRGEYGL